MSGNEVVTIGLASLVLVAFLGGLAVARWQSGPLQKLKEEILAEVRRLHGDAGKRSDELAEDVAALQQRLNDYELFVERKFVSRDTFNLVLGRLEKGVAEIQQTVFSTAENAKARLIRIESHLSPSFQLPPLDRSKGTE